MPNFPTAYEGIAGIALPSDEQILHSADLNVSRMLAGTGDMSYGFITLVHAIFGAKDIDARMREIIGLRTAKLLHTPYQWQQHATMGKNAGLTPAEIDAMATDGAVSGIPDDYMLLTQATDELTMNAVLTDATLTSLQRRYGDKVTRKLVLPGWSRRSILSTRTTWRKTPARQVLPNGERCRLRETTRRRSGA